MQIISFIKKLKRRSSKSSDKGSDGKDLIRILIVVKNSNEECIKMKESLLGSMSVE